MKKRFLMQCAAIVGASAAAVLACWERMPAIIPVHWNAAGEVDGWASRFMIFEFSALMIGLALLWSVLPQVSPKNYEVERFGPTWWRGGLVLVALLAGVQLLILLNAIGQPVAVDRALAAALALSMVLVGNMFGKVRRNFWLGIRTPWALADDRVWHATHRLAGKTTVTGGLLALGALLLGLPAGAAVALVVAGTLAPAGYSLVVYKRLERSGGLRT